MYEQKNPLTEEYRLSINLSRLFYHLRFSLTKFLKDFSIIISVG